MTDTMEVPETDIPQNEELFNHPFFARNLADMEGTPAYEALQAMKYETEDPNANAESYKEEGNRYVTEKYFDKAVTAYTGGILAKPTDSKILAILYTNRAIANGMMRNHGSCVKDCKQAIKYAPDHVKAYVQAAKSLIILQKPSEAMELCKAGLSVAPSDTKLVELNEKAKQLEEKINLEKSQKSNAILQDCGRLKHIIKQLISRGINVNLELPPIGLPESAGVAISFDHMNKIHWPVLVMYPEFNQTDFVQDAGEFLTIEHCLKQLLDSSNPPPWDTDKAYTASFDELEVYYEDVTIAKQMVPIPLSLTITALTKTPGFFVRRDLVIVLLVVSKLSKNFHKAWMAGLRG